MSLQGTTKNMANTTAKCHPMEKETCENIRIYSSTGLGTMQLLAFPQSQKTMKSKYYESIQDIKGALTVQLKAGNSTFKKYILNVS